MWIEQTDDEFYKPAVAQSRAEGANLTDVLSAAFSSGMWKVNIPFIAENDFWLAKPENLQKFYSAAFEAGKADNISN